MAKSEDAAKRHFCQTNFLSLKIFVFALFFPGGIVRHAFRLDLLRKSTQ